jgi:hypothetical protein
MHRIACDLLALDVGRSIIRIGEDSGCREAHAVARRVLLTKILAR